MIIFLKNLRKHLKINFMPRKKEVTIRERIISIYNEFDIPQEKEGVRGKFINSVMELIERAKSPEIFCQKCDTRMSIDLESGSLHCFNCGARRKIEQLSQPIIKTAPTKTNVVLPKTEANPNVKKPNQKLLDAIDNAEKGPQGNKKGKSIQELANNRGQSEVTKEDEDMIKKSVPGAKNAEINWS